MCTRCVRIPLKTLACNTENCWRRLGTYSQFGQKKRDGGQELIHTRYRQKEQEEGVIRKHCEVVGRLSVGVDVAVKEKERKARSDGVVGGPMPVD